MIFNIKDFFDISKDLDSRENTVERIISGISFRGATMWILIAAIFVASLGLNVNSTAVIIGAMLISPLMGPIVGMGLAIGINDLDLLKRAARNFAAMTIISILTATFYFLISPYREVQSELLARTSPTVYDVLIAFVGGAAGVIALFVKDKGNVLPGVAIATALMPPLCTAGFGLASGNIQYFAGAFFLYFINTVFIALATYVGVRLMHFRSLPFADKQQERMVHRTIAAIVLITLLPAAYMTWRIVNKSIFNRQVNVFMRDQLSWDGSSIVANSVDNDSTIRVVVVGKEVSEEQIKTAQQAMKAYTGLDGYKLQVIQGLTTDSISMKYGLFSQYAATQDGQQQMIEKSITENKNLHQQLEQYTHLEDLSLELGKETKILFPTVQRIGVTRTMLASVDTALRQPVVIALVKSTPKMSAQETGKLSSWLKERSGVDSLTIVMLP